MAEGAGWLIGSWPPAPWEWLLLILVLAAVLSLLLGTVIYGAPPVPSSPESRRVMLNHLERLPEGPVYELGSGWGGLARAAAAHFPDRQVIAYERAPIPYLASLALQLVWRRPNLVLRRGDFHRADLSRAAAVLCYLFPEPMRRLEPKFAAELKNEALVISQSFALPNRKPDLVDESVSSLSTIFLYRYR